MTQAGNYHEPLSADRDEFSQGSIPNPLCSFFVPIFRKEVTELAERTRTNRNEFHLNDDEQYILDEKF